MLGKIFFTELLMTFIFVLIVLTVAKHNGVPSMPVNAFTIGCGLYFCIQTAGYVSGGAINPAVGLC
jgi:glycerol uptake facilitator-like aquaporin